jgi:hypothetical protein
MHLINLIDQVWIGSHLVPGFIDGAHSVEVPAITIFRLRAAVCPHAQRVKIASPASVAAGADRRPASDPLVHLI